MIDTMHLEPRPSTLMFTIGQFAITWVGIHKPFILAQNTKPRAFIIYTRQTNVYKPWVPGSGEHGFDAAAARRAGDGAAAVAPRQDEHAELLTAGQRQHALIL